MHDTTGHVQEFTDLLTCGSIRRQLGFCVNQPIEVYVTFMGHYGPLTWYLVSSNELSAKSTLFALDSRYRFTIPIAQQAIGRTCVDHLRVQLCFLALVASLHLV
jgi:hypothetical protein